MRLATANMTLTPFLREGLAVAVGESLDCNTLQSKTEKYELRANGADYRP